MTLSLGSWSGSCLGPGPSATLAELYRESLNDTGDGGAEELIQAEERRDRRIQATRQLLEGNPDLGPEARLHAASILLDSQDPADLARAEDLALTAAVGGDERGFPLAAEAIDRQLMLRGELQRYGTQYVWSAASAGWSLYPCDPSTSDVERQAMGLPTLSEARALASGLD